MRTKVSALMDGELETHECSGVLRALNGDAALRDEWREFQLVGDALRREYGLEIDIGARVMSALAAEPTVLAPHRAPAASSSRWARPALALAASLAGVAVVGWVALAPGVSPLGDGGAQLAQAPKQDPVRVAQQAAPVAPAAAAIEDRLHEYLVAHQAHAPTGGLESGTRYVRTVSAMGGLR